MSESSSTQLSLRIGHDGDAWSAYIDIDDQPFWHGGPYETEQEALAHGHSRMQTFASMLARKAEP